MIFSYTGEGTSCLLNHSKHNVLATVMDVKSGKRLYYLVFTDLNWPNLVYIVVDAYYLSG